MRSNRDDQILPSGHSTADFEGEEHEYLKEKYFSMKDGAIRCNPGGIVMPVAWKATAKAFYDFKFSPAGDVVVLTYPKSGTTWTQEIVWNLIHNPDGGHPRAADPIHARFPVFDCDCFMHLSDIDLPDETSPHVQKVKQLCPDDPNIIKKITITLATHMPSPRLLKAHTPLTLFSPDILQKCKMIYVARDPRDVVNSFWYFSKLHKIWKFSGTRDEFIDDFINDRVIYAPYFQHVKSAWDQRHHPNMHFLYFEDMKADPIKEVAKIDKFLGTKRTEEQIKKVAEMCHFENVKERQKNDPPGSNQLTYYDKEEMAKGNVFFRKGIVGDWKNNFNEEQAEKLNKWVEKNLRAFGPEFKYQTS